MARIKIDLPESFSFSTSITVRITDLNYGAHVGNDTVLSFIHEARFHYLQSLGYTELNLEGVGLIMAVEFSRVGFDLVYKMEKNPADQPLITVALVKTMMVCFDYEQKKVAPLPEKAIFKLKA